MAMTKCQECAREMMQHASWCTVPARVAEMQRTAKLLKDKDRKPPNDTAK